MRIPERLRETVARVHGATGDEWLLKLPLIINYWRERWELDLTEPFENLSYNLLIPGRDRKGAAIVLKLGVPCPELVTEAAALKLFQGVGAVRLLKEEAGAGALLMERVNPGTPLSELGTDAERTSVAAALMRALWRNASATDSFPSLAFWFQAFERVPRQFGDGHALFPFDLVKRAERAFRELEASTERRVLLHGDLHHDNILFSARTGWVAIDPKGIVGDPGYEVGPFMINRLPEGASAAATLEIFSQRLSIFSDKLEISRERLTLWAFCYAVLSALWEMEEGAEWQGIIGLARLLEKLI